MLVWRKGLIMRVPSTHMRCWKTEGHHHLSASFKQRREAGDAAKEPPREHRGKKKVGHNFAAACVSPSRSLLRPPLPPRTRPAPRSRVSRCSGTAASRRRGAMEETNSRAWVDSGVGRDDKDTVQQVGASMRAAQSSCALFLVQ